MLNNSGGKPTLKLLTNGNTRKVQTVQSQLSYFARY